MSGFHIPFNTHRSLVGTARYASINTHLGVEQSRRDDMESIGYLFVYLLKSILPWQNVQADSKKEKYIKIMDKKMNIPVEILCANTCGINNVFKSHIAEFVTYLNYTKSLKFEDKPEYTFLRKLFRSALDTGNFPEYPGFDWNLTADAGEVNEEEYPEVLQEEEEIPCERPMGHKICVTDYGKSFGPRRYQSSAGGFAKHF